jgi:hypothetical protein
MRTLVPGIVALGLRLVVGVFVGAAVVASLAERTWLGQRTWWVIGFAVVALGVAWWPRGRQGMSVWAAWWGLVAAIVAATALGRIPPGDPVPGQSVSTGMSERILGRDLPPHSVYTAVVALALVVVLGVVLALPWRTRVQKLSHQGAGIGLACGLVVAAIALPAVHRGTAEVRELVDRRWESDAVTATTIGAGRRTEVSGGPTVPTEIAWHTPASREDDGGAGLVSIPGWDVVIMKTARYDDARRDPDSLVASGIQAISKDDGTVVWSYWRHDGEIDTATVDPDSGRVLVLAGRAAVVLDLVSGSEITARPVPDWLANGVLVGKFRRDTRPTEPVTVGRWAVVEQGWGSDDGGTLGVVEVATGDVVATASIPSRSCDYALATTNATPVIVQWTSQGDCGGPHLLHLDGSSLRATDITFSGWPDDDAERCRMRCLPGRLLVTDEVIVVSIWTEELGGDGDILAMSHDGQTLWRASDTVERPRLAMDDGAFVVAVTDQHVVAWWGDEWHLLSLTDGTVQARAAHCGNSFETATDGELIYVACQEPDRTAVFRIEDLELLSDSEPGVGSWRVAYASDGYLITALHLGGIAALGPRAETDR